VTPSPPNGPTARVRGLTGLDALQATWAPSVTACSADWQRSDHQLRDRSQDAVRWWTAWQRAKDWLSRAAPGLRWLDHDDPVELHVGS